MAQGRAGTFTGTLGPLGGFPFSFSSCSAGRLQPKFSRDGFSVLDATGTPQLLVLDTLLHNDCHHPGAIENNLTYFMHGGLWRVP